VIVGRVAIVGLALAALVVIALGYIIRGLNAPKVPQAIGERAFAKIDASALTELEEFF
jgi:hypothetical protein